VEGSAFHLAVGRYRLSVVPDGLPSIIEDYRARAKCVDEDVSSKGTRFCVTVSDGSWPSLVISQSCEPHGGGFYPGALIVPETDVLFLGAGEKLWAYDLATPKRLWQESVEYGFLGWARHGDVALMSAECELSAWDLEGRKLWTALDLVYVEPPWSYSVEGETLILDVMGKIFRFPLKKGPKAG
jgi:hypothetical protein